MTGRDGGFGLTVLTPEQQIAAVLTRDARRVRRLAWLTVGLWVMTALLIGLLIAGLFLPITSFARNVQSELKHELEGKAYKERTLEQRVLGRFLSIHGEHLRATSFLAAAVGLLALSALGTVILVHATRRATLRQIQVSLADISAQLADLRQRTADPASGGRQPPVSGSSTGG